MPIEATAATARASRVGSLVGVGCVVLSAAVLALLTRQSLMLVLAVFAMAIPQAFVSYRIGERVGIKIANSPTLIAVPVGARAGLEVLLSTAITASAVGFCWGLRDGMRGSDWAYSYIGKPFLAVLAYGFFMAISLGVLAGLLIRALTSSLGGDSSQETSSKT